MKRQSKYSVAVIGATGAGAMMLDALGQSAAALAIEEAVMRVTAEKLKSLAAGRMGYRTEEVGDLVVENLEA